MKAIDLSGRGTEINGVASSTIYMEFKSMIILHFVTII